MDQPSPALPPVGWRIGGESDDRFLAIADEMAQRLREQAGLRDDSSVLDIGCGNGRLVYGLRRSGWRGRYLGVDVMAPLVQWGEHELGDEQVRFRHVDVRNERYNPEGSVRPDELDLGAETFDVVCLFSVFTHMWPDDISSYLRLGRRALAPGGRMLATFFLDNRGLRRAERAGATAFTLPHRRWPNRWMSDQEPLHVVATSQLWVRVAAWRAGLRFAARPVYGSWSGSGQDIVVLAPRRLLRMPR